MAEARPADGVVAIEMGRAFALFGDATAAPPRASDAALAEAARTWVRAWSGFDLPVLYATQVHSRLSFTFSTERPLASGAHHVGQCDALITGESGVVLTVRTADCLPVVLAGDGAIAIVHGGWRGLAADILGATVHRLEVDFGVSRSAMAAAIGVGVGACHYEVGGEVVEALRRHDVGARAWRSDDRVDLASLAAGRLAQLGIERVRRLSGCTACTPRYHSYRRDGERAGRQWSAVVNLEG